MNKKKIILLVATSVLLCAAFLIPLNNSGVLNFTANATMRRGNTPFQIILDESSSTGWSTGNQGSDTYRHSDLSTTTSGGSTFEASLYVYTNGYLNGNVSYPAGSLVRAVFTKGDIFLDLSFTLKNITSPSSVVIDGEFSNSKNGAPDVTKLTYTNFTDNGDNSFSFKENTSSALYMTIQIDKITINYTCY